jgi:hypothetical protein
MREVIELLRPFYAAVFNDNGDVTISTGHLNVRDWLGLYKAFKALTAASDLSPSDREMALRAMRDAKDILIGAYSGYIPGSRSAELWQKDRDESIKTLTAAIAKLEGGRG